MKIETPDEGGRGFGIDLEENLLDRWVLVLRFQGHVIFNFDIVLQLPQNVRHLLEGRENRERFMCRFKVGIVSCSFLRSWNWFDIQRLNLCIKI